jgi:hypothetical protein
VPGQVRRRVAGRAARGGGGFSRRRSPAAQNRSWAVEHAAAIFPADPDESGLWEAAWDTYITQAPIAADVCIILDDRYRMAVAQLDPAATDRPVLVRAFHLGRHLLTRYWGGDLTLDNHDQMLRRLYQNAPASVRVDLMRLLGRSIRDTDTINGTVAGRLTDFWEARLQAVHDGAEPSELTEFGDWFAAGKLGDDWELQQLLTVLRLAGQIESTHQVLKRLASLAATHTRTCMEALQAWVQSRPAPFNLQQQQESIRVILRTGLGANDEALTEIARTIVSLCITEGLDLRDIFDSGQ